MKITKTEYKMFQIYAIEYKNKMLKNNIEKALVLENKMNKISRELSNYVKTLVELDIEFKTNVDKLPDPVKYFLQNSKILQSIDYINNTSWEGFWKRCSGKDLEYFISYLEYPIIYPKNKNYIKNNKNLIDVFKYETGFYKIPYGVKCAQLINSKYFM